MNPTLRWASAVCGSPGRHLPCSTTQLAAIAAAAAATDADVWVMAPMVATAAEAAAFTESCREHGLPTAGVMIEVPAAALRAGQLLRHVDFLSVGTNDLSQYTFAADRMCGDLADLLDPWQPALIALLASCATAGVEAGKPVGVCGESAADPSFALVLAGLGITSLSMAPRSIPAVRECPGRAHPGRVPPDRRGGPCCPQPGGSPGGGGGASRQLRLGDGVSVR